MDDVRAHIEEGDLFEWLHLCYPDWFHAEPISDPATARKIDYLLRADCSDDTGGHLVGSNGSLLMIHYLAHGLRRFAQGTR